MERPEVVGHRGDEPLVSVHAYDLVAAQLRFVTTQLAKGQAEWQAEMVSMSNRLEHADKLNQDLTLTNQELTNAANNLARRLDQVEAQAGPMVQRAIQAEGMADKLIAHIVAARVGGTQTATHPEDTAALLMMIEEMGQHHQYWLTILDLLTQYHKLEGPEDAMRLVTAYINDGASQPDDVDDPVLLAELDAGDAEPDPNLGWTVRSRSCPSCRGIWNRQAATNHPGLVCSNSWHDTAPLVKPKGLAPTDLRASASVADVMLPTEEGLSPIARTMAYPVRPIKDNPQA